MTKNHDANDLPGDRPHLLRRVLTERLAEVVAEVCRLGEMPGNATLTVGGVTVQLSTEPIAAAAGVHEMLGFRFTDCMKDMIAVLAVAPRRMTGPEIIEAMLNAGRTHGESTVKRDLPGLRREGIVTHVLHFGYAITDRGRREAERFAVERNVRE